MGWFLFLPHDSAWLRMVKHKIAVTEPIDIIQTASHSLDMKLKIPEPKEIEAAAKAKGLSIAALCRRADIDPSTFNRWAAGRGVPSVRSVQRMIDAIEREPKP
jgi:DNA-binding transcriptional regulator YiaG